MRSWFMSWHFGRPPLDFDIIVSSLTVRVHPGRVASLADGSRLVGLAWGEFPPINDERWRWMVYNYVEQTAPHHYPIGGNALATRHAIPRDEDPEAPNTLVDREAHPRGGDVPYARRPTRDAGGGCMEPRPPHRTEDGVYEHPRMEPRRFNLPRGRPAFGSAPRRLKGHGTITGILLAQNIGEYFHDTDEESGLAMFWHDGEPSYAKFYIGKGPPPPTKPNPDEPRRSAETRRPLRWLLAQLGQRGVYRNPKISPPLGSVSFFLDVAHPDGRCAITVYLIGEPKPLADQTVSAVAVEYPESQESGFRFRKTFVPIP
jgi:hypothetical protein